MTALPCRWSGEELIPLQGHKKRAAADLVVGQVYIVEVTEQRSAKSHAFYFASLNDIWQSLPEEYAERFQTVETFRKRALIETGYRDETSIVCASAAEARRMAAFMRPIDEFAVISVNGAALVRWTAKSQSMRAMGKQQFEASKRDVLDWCSDLIGAQAQKEGEKT